MDAIKKMIDKRQEANLEILNEIRLAILKYPDLRFGQILINLGIVQLIHDPESFDITGAKDPFYEESVITLQRMKNNNVL